MDRIFRGRTFDRRGSGGRRRLALRFGALALLVACARPAPDPGSGAGAAGTATGGEMSEVDARFFTDVAAGSLEPNACTPPLPSPDWKGLAIAAPSRVTLAAATPRLRIPIAGRYVLPVERRPFASLQEGLVLHAREVTTGATHVGSLASADPGEPPPEDEPLTDAELEGLTVGGYFNLHLQDHLDLPHEAGVYEVYVSLGDALSSNTVTLRIVDGSAGR